MKPALLSLFAAAALLPLSSLLAQPSSSAADTAWQAVKDAGRTKNGNANGNSNRVADLNTAADQLRNFYTSYPDHPEAKNAKCLEALALVRAWQAGDTSQQQRRAQAVADVKHDTGVTPSLRAELFALSDTVAITKSRGLSRDGRLQAFERATRDLIAEFPDLTNGYEALLHVAHDSPDARAPGLAQEVATMAAAPDWVKAQAKTIAARFALLGGALDKTTAGISDSAATLTGTKGHPVFVYSWSSASVASVRRAQVLPKLIPPDSTVIGVCLDQDDLAAAKAAAATNNLPGKLLYDRLGAGGAWATALVLNEPGLIYRVGSSGTIRSVAAQNDLDAPFPATAD